MNSYTEKAYRFYLQKKEKIERAVEASRQRLSSLQVPDTNGYWHSIEIRDATSFYKVVATVGEELVSVFDGITRYAIGRWTLGKHAPNGWPPMSSCFFAHQAESKALAASFPKDSKLLTAPKVLIEVTASGKAYFNSRTGVWALSRVRPVRILPDIIRLSKDTDNSPPYCDSCNSECPRQVLAPRETASSYTA